MRSTYRDSQNVKQSELFHDIPPEHIPAILDSGNHRTVAKDQVLFSQGEPARRCYFLLCGKLKLSKLHEQGREAVIKYVSPGELAAVAAVLKGQIYPLSAKVVSDAELLCWDRNMLEEIMRSYPQLAVNMLCIILGRLEEMQQRFIELSAEQTERRIAKALLRIMQHAGTRTGEGIRIELDISREDLAEFTGTTQYTVSRILSDWIRKGWISSSRRNITITDVHSLVILTEGCQR